MKIKKINKQIILAFVLISLGIYSRIFIDLAPNFELVTAISVIAGLYIKNKRIALLIPISIMFISDSVIGNTNIFIFTWSGMLLGTVLGSFAERIKQKTIFKSTIISLVAVSIFFLWTNFGVWLTTEMYSKNLNGVISCYINALPFLKNQLLSAIIATPAVTLLAECIYKYNKLFNYKNHEA